MASIKFRNLSQQNAEDLVVVFDYLAEEKRLGDIKEEELSKLLKDRYKTKFWWPSKEELDDWMKRWQAAPISTRYTDPSLNTPWVFGSWVEALMNAEICLQHIAINDTGDGELVFEQLTCPSGGI